MSQITKDSLLIGFSERLNAVCDAMGVPPKGKNRQAAMAALFYVSPNGARKWLDGEGMPTFEKAIRIACWAGVTVEWLMTGRGDAKAVRGDGGELSTDLIAQPPGDVWRMAGKLAALALPKRLAIEGVIDAFSA